MAEPTDILVIVPTNGSVRNGDDELIPSEVGRMRLARAAKLLREVPNTSLAIVGGYRQFSLNSEAQVARRFFIKNYPELAKRIVVTDASSKYIAGDMVALAKIIGDPLTGLRLRNIQRAVFVTHHDHAELAIKTLSRAEASGAKIIYTHIDSGEPPPYTPLQLAILKLVTGRDPSWRTILSWPLRFLANRRGGQE